MFDKTRLSGRILRSSSAATLSQVWRMGVTFVTHMVLRRLVLPDEWGFWHWAVDFLFVILGQVRDLGLPAHMVRDGARRYGNFLVVELVLGLALGLLVFLASPTLAAQKSLPHLVPLLQALTLFLFLEGLAKVPLTYFEAELQIERALVPEIARNLCYSALAISLAYLGFGIFSMVVAHVTATAVFAGMLWWRALGVMPLGVAWGEFGSLCRKGVPLMAMAMVLLAIESVDYQILWGRFSDDLVGMYGSTIILVMLVPRAVEYPLRRALYPAFVAVRDDTQRFFEIYRLSTLLIMSLHVLMAGFLWCNAELLLTLAWGAQYAGAAGFVKILCWMPLVQPFARCAEDALLPIYRERILILGSVVTLVSLIGFGFYLSGVLGPAGMAWARLLPLGSALVAWAVYSIYPRGFRGLAGDLALIYVIGFVAFGAAYLAGPDAGFGLLALSVLAGLASSVVYIVVFKESFMRLREDLAS